MAQIAAPTTTREDLVLAVRKSLDLPSKAAAKKTLDTVLGTIAATLQANGTKKGYTLRLHELVNFTVVAVAKKDGRNPATGEKKTIPARTKIKAVLVKGLKDLGK